jgi:uncharacterized protein (DUF58 family)
LSDETLIPAPARQGPGAMPRELVDALDLALAKQATQATQGDRRSVGIGLGTELAQLRPYQVGDDVRHLDAAATARTGEPHVRAHVPERTLATWILLDISPSMAFGTQQRLKSDVAEGVATVVGRLAVRRAGALGIVRFGAPGGVRLSRLRASRPAIVALDHALREGVAQDGHADPDGLADAATRLGRIARQPGLIVVISDFRGQHEFAKSLGALRARHSVLAVEVIDPREADVPAVGRLAVVDPETGRHVQVDTSRPRVRERFRKIEAERRDELAATLRRLRVEHVALSTQDDWLTELGRGLR